MKSVEPKKSRCVKTGVLYTTARQNTVADDEGNGNCDSDDIAELCRGHFSCRQLCLLLARFQISQNCIFRQNWNCIFCENFLPENAGAREYAKLYRHNLKFVAVTFAQEFSKMNEVTKQKLTSSVQIQHLHV